MATQIAFSSQRGGSSSELFVMKTDGSGVQQISNLFGANGWYPAWAPDGRLLSFTSERSNEADVYSMDYQGQDIKQSDQGNELAHLDRLVAGWRLDRVHGRL